MFVDTLSASGDGQMMARCPKCYVVLYSDYDGDGKWVTFVRAATLDDASKKNVRPTAHIYTTTKKDWIDLTSEKQKGIPIFEAHYPRKDIWTKEANERFDAVKAKMEEADRASKSD